MKNLSIGSTIKDGIQEAWIDNGDGKGKQYLIKGGQKIEHSPDKPIKGITYLDTKGHQ